MPFEQAQNAYQDGQDAAYSPANAQTKVLLVDDGRALNGALEAFLETEGHQVLKAGTAQEALAKTAQFQPDLILLDSAAVDGPFTSLLGELLLEQSSAAVIILARTPSIDDAVESIRLGAIDYLPAPLDTQKLKRAIEAQKALF
jgi:DNA-binding NtrC family response regulator